MSTAMQQEITGEGNGNTSAGKPHLFPDKQICTQSQLSASPSPSCFQTLFSWRGYMALQLHCFLLLLFILLQNMPFALVCMMESPAHNASSIPDDGNGTFEDVQRLEWKNSSDADFSGAGTGEFDWDSSIRGLLLSAVSMLAFITPLMSDFCSRLVGAKILIFWTMFLSGGITLLQPLGTRLSPYVLVALRVLIGFTGGMKFSLVNELFSWWAPDRERVTMVSFAYAAPNTASIVVSLTSGYLCSVPVDNGWPFIFYVHGALALCWCLLWQFTGSIKPEDHPYISEDEKQYIIKTRRGMDKMQKRSKPPYREIFTSVPIWGYMTIMITHSYSIFVIMAFTPVYFKTAFGFSVEKVGVIVSVIYVVRLVGVLCWGQMSNLLRRKTRLSLTACRKVIQCTGHYSSGAGLVALAFVREEMWAVSLVCGVLLMQSSVVSSGIVMPLDMAPRYAGFITGFAVTMSILVTIPGPIVTSYMVGKGTFKEWRNVFLGFGGVAFVGATCFLLMASSELQSWAKPGDRKEDAQKKCCEGKEGGEAVMSLGIPASPSRKQRRLEFSFPVEAPNFTEAKLEMNSSHLALPSSAPDPSAEAVSSLSENIPMTVISTEAVSSLSENIPMTVISTEAVSSLSEHIPMTVISTEAVSSLSENIPMTDISNHRSALSPSSEKGTATTTLSHGEELESSAAHRTQRSSGRASGTDQGHHPSLASDSGRNGAFSNLGFDGSSESRD